MDSAGQFLEKADLIEFINGNSSPAHWGIYDGTGYVIHVTGDVISKSTNSAATVLAAVLGNVNSSVIKESLKMVAAGRKFYKNNMLDETYPPLNADDIIRKASEFIDTLWDYKLFSSNCEHFASKMRYGVAISLQAIDATRKVAVVSASVSASVLGSLALSYSR